MRSFSALQRAEIAEIKTQLPISPFLNGVSVLFNEPKLPKCASSAARTINIVSFSALQRAEIAEIWDSKFGGQHRVVFQCSSTSRNCRNRRRRQYRRPSGVRFSALQRAEIAEIHAPRRCEARSAIVSVLFNEPKLPKSTKTQIPARVGDCFSALQRAEIAEIHQLRTIPQSRLQFQCSSTSRNCRNWSC